MEFVHARTRCLGTDGLKCTDLSENIHTDLVLRVWGIRPVVKVVGSVNKCSIFDYTKSGIGDSQIWQKVPSSLMKKLWSAFSTICKCTLKRPKWVHQEKKFIISSGWVHQGLDNVVHCKSRFAIKNWNLALSSVLNLESLPAWSTSGQIRAFLFQIQFFSFRPVQDFLKMHQRNATLEPTGNWQRRNVNL